jgi:DNA-binding CsgD family transcriptional regulator
VDRMATDSAAQFLAIALACANCRSEADFGTVVRSSVRALLPHSSLLAIIGRIDLDHLEIRRVLSVDHPEGHLPLISRTMNMRDRQVVAFWLKDTSPLVVQLPDDRDLMSEREAQEIEAFDLGRLGICGMVDAEAKTGTYLSFAGLSPSVSVDEHRKMLRLLAPPLSQALMVIDRMSYTSAGTRQELSRAERELLRWVAAGHTNRDIAKLRGRSVATVRNQLHSAYVKLGVGSRTEALRIVLGAPSLIDLSDKPKL